MTTKRFAVTILLLLALYAGIAILMPDYAKAALGMAIGALCFPVAYQIISIFGGEDGA